MRCSGAILGASSLPAGSSAGQVRAAGPGCGGPAGLWLTVQPLRSPRGVSGGMARRPAALLCCSLGPEAARCAPCCIGHKASALQCCHSTARQTCLLMKGLARLRAHVLQGCRGASKQPLPDSRPETCSRGPQERRCRRSEFCLPFCDSLHAVLQPVLWPCPSNAWLTPVGLSEGCEQPDANSRLCCCSLGQWPSSANIAAWLQRAGACNTSYPLAACSTSQTVTVLQSMASKPRHRLAGKSPGNM